MTETAPAAESAFLARLKGELDEAGLKYRVGSKGSYVVLTFAGRKFELEVVVFWDETYVSVHGFYPFIVDQQVVPRVLSTLNDLSVRHPVGGFELHSDSRVTFKVGARMPLLTQPGGIAHLVMFCATTANDSADAIYSAL